MRAVIIADEFFASRERPMLERLEVGLADEGVRVFHAVPESAARVASGGLYTRAVTYSDRTLALTLTLEARRLARALEQITISEGESQIDLVHVFGGSAWRLGRELARLLGAGLVLEVWRPGLLDAAKGLAGAGEREPRTVLMAPDTTIERALVGGVGSDLPVRLAPWGVHAPLTPREVLPPGAPWTALIVGSGYDTRAFHAALAGLARASASCPEGLLFVDAVAARRADLWSEARRLNLLANLSLIEEIEGRRDLLLQGDLLILPEAQGEQRTVVLEAMASGMIVVAASDPQVSMLQDGRTARTVPERQAGAWGAVLEDVLRHPERTRALTASANEYVRTQRRASDHVRGVLATYQLLAGPDSLAFPA